MCITQQTRQPVALSEVKWRVGGRARDIRNTVRMARALMCRARQCCLHIVAFKAEWHALRPPT